MLKKITGLIAAATLFTTASANATVLTFDDYTTNSGATSLGGSNYGGFNWVNDFYILDAAEYQNASGYKNNLISGDYVALNWFARDISLNGAEFDFNGAYFGAAWNDGLSIQIQGSNNGNVIYDETIVVDTQGGEWFDLSFNNIDSLSFNSFGGVKNNTLSGSGLHFTMDNFTFNVKVPEPAPMALLAVGGLLAFRAKRKA